MATARGVLLLSRTFLVTGMAVFLAAAAHAAGGGGIPPGMLLLALAVILLPPVGLLARRRLSFPVLACVLAAGQLLLHTAFSFVPAASACAVAGPAAHAHHTEVPVCGPAGQVGEQLAEAAGNGWQMTAAHFAAVVLTAVLLARGEDALWQLLAWLRPLARIPSPVTLPAPAPALFTIREAAFPPAGTEPCVHRLRGPPAFRCS